MVKQTKCALGMRRIFLVIPAIIVVLAAIVAPTLAVPPEIGLKKGDVIAAVKIVDIIERETIECIRVIEAGDATWCDVFVGIPRPDPTEEIVEFKAMSTDDPMIQALLVAAHAGKIKVTVRGHKISKPAERPWPSKVVLFYKITEVKVDPFYMLHSP